jgi:hypothetical protein
MARIAVFATSLLLLPAPVAQAKAPPKGKYDCTIGNGILFGTLNIKSKSNYKHRGKKGSYTHGAKKKTFSDGKKGWTLKFKGGTLDGMRGRWYPTPTSGSVTHEIALRNPIDDFESIYCDKWKR